MRVRRTGIVRLTVAALLLAAGVSCARYHPEPLHPMASAAEFVARGDHDPALRRYLAAHGIVPADSGWTPSALAFVALYYSGELDSARAALATARAAEITAARRVQPGGSISLGRAAEVDRGKSSHWSVALGSGITIEPGGKRRARLAVARARTIAAALGVQATAWRVALGAERAAIGAEGAGEDVAAAAAELAALDSVAALSRARYAEGSASASAVARAEADARAAAFGVTDARRIGLAMRDSLARAAGIPSEVAHALTLAPGAEPACTLAAVVPGDSLRSLALHNRSDLGALLAAYSAAEGELRLEIARQRPDVVLGPGFGWNQGIIQWTLGLSLPSIAIDRNRGPIAEAVARRGEAATRFLRLQQRVIQQTGAARLECANALDQVHAATDVVREVRRRVGLAEAAYRRGETGTLDVALARLALARAERALAAARVRSRSAGVALQEAIGTSLGRALFDPHDALVSPRRDVSVDSAGIRR